jgi:hypothetical protein
VRNARIVSQHIDGPEFLLDFGHGITARIIVANIPFPGGDASCRGELPSPFIVAAVTGRDFVSRSRNVSEIASPMPHVGAAGSSCSSSLQDSGVTGQASYALIRKLHVAFVAPDQRSDVIAR